MKKFQDILLWVRLFTVILLKNIRLTIPLLKQQAANIKYTAVRSDQLRRLLGRPLIVTSWYRSGKVNRKVGGSRTSAHSSGLAVDVLLKKGSQYKEFQK